MSVAVEPERTVRRSLALLRGAQKTSKGAPLYSILINRPAGRLFAAVAHQARLRPNQVTAISAMFTFAGIAAIAVVPISVPMGFAIALTLCVGYALDSSDGQLARLRGGGSMSGEWLDHVFDAGKISSIHLAVLIALYRHFNQPEWAMLGPIVFAVVNAVQFFAVTLNDQLRRNRRSQFRTGATISPSASPLWVTVVRIPVDYGVLCLSFAVLGFGTAFVVLYGLLALGSLVHLLALLPKWYRDIKGLDHTTAECESSR